MYVHSLPRTACVVVIAAALELGSAACTNGSSEQSVTAASAAQAAQAGRKGCDENNGGLVLPAGFCAAIFADHLGHARHIAVAPNGDVYVNTSSSKSHKFTNAPGGFIVALRDADYDGRAEVVQRFGTEYRVGQPGGGTGIAVHDGALYVEQDDRIVRYGLGGNAVVPSGHPEVVVKGFSIEGDHTAHPFAITRDGVLFVNSGSMSNSCQEVNRTLESPGQKPCRELDTHAGIWRYDATKRDQTFSAKERYATGLRNTMALAIQPNDGALYVTVHGRDQLSDNWPRLYTEAQNNELPAEIFARVQQGKDYGWPQCYYDPAQTRNVLAPEYGGDGGKAEGECTSRARPDFAFPAHWAPEAMAFYGGPSFPNQYQSGAFISFHGSWNRRPTQAGFLVAFLPFRNGRPAGPYEEFVKGFTGASLPADPTKAPHRPMGVAVAPDGSLFVTDDVGGRVWRISYVGALSAAR